METQLLTFIHKLSQNLDRIKQTDIAILRYLLLDFSKAFDKVSVIVSRECPELDIAFFFTKRSQCVVFKGEASDTVFK